MWPLNKKAGSASSAVHPAQQQSGEEQDGEEVDGRPGGGLQMGMSVSPHPGTYVNELPSSSGQEAAGVGMNTMDAVQNLVLPVEVGGQQSHHHHHQQQQPGVGQPGTRTAMARATAPQVPLRGLSRQVSVDPVQWSAATSIGGGCCPAAFDEEAPRPTAAPTTSVHESLGETGPLPYGAGLNTARSLAGRIFQKAHDEAAAAANDSDDSTPRLGSEASMMKVVGNSTGESWKRNSSTSSSSYSSNGDQEGHGDRHYDFNNGSSGSNLSMGDRNSGVGVPNLSNTQALRITPALTGSASSAALVDSILERKKRSRKRDRRRDNIVTFFFGHDEKVFENPYARAVVGALLTVAESKPGPGFVSARLIPAVEIAIAISQLSMLNDLLVPFFVPHQADIMAFLHSIFLLKLDLRVKSADIAMNMGMCLILVLSAFASLFLLCVLFSFNVKSPTVSRVVPTYLRLVTGVLFLPICEAFVATISGAFLAGSTGAWVKASVVILTSTFFLPFCLLISQNRFDSDESSGSLINRQHNRTDLVYLLMKILITIGRHSADELTRRTLNLIAFSAIFLTHYCTQIYWKQRLNRFYNGVYAAFCAGALCRFGIAVNALVHRHAASSSSSSRIISFAPEVVFWALVIPVFLVFWAQESLQMAAVRFRVNEYLVNRLVFLDLADNATLIQNFGLISHLRSATRIGRYAQLLVAQGDQEGALELFEKALASDPDHPDNLGNYANLLVSMGQANVASELFERALRRNSQHRHNLESYATYLNNERGSDQALQLYQRSLLTYLEHLSFRDAYAASSECAFVVQVNGKILDCNGAAMALFHAPSRASLCNHRNLVDLVHGNKDKLRLRKVLVALDKTDMRSDKLTMSMNNNIRGVMTVVVSASRIQHGRRRLLHVSVVDITDLQQASELATQTFQKGASPMIIIDQEGIIRQFNEAAVAFFDYTAAEAIGMNVSMLMPDSFARQHNGFIARYLETGRGGIIGAAPRNVPVVTRSGERGVCSLKVNKMAIGAGEGSTTFFVGILHDVTQTTEALALAEASFEKANSPMVLITETGVISNWNACASSTFKYTAEDAIGRNISFLMPEPFRTEHGGYLRHYLETGEKKVIGQARNVSVMTADGHRLVCNLKVNELMAGDRRMFVGILHDVTQATEALALAEASFEKAYSPMVLITEAGIIAKWNACASSTFKYTAEEATNRNISFLMPEPFRAQHDGFLRRYLETGEKRIIGQARDVPVVTGEGKNLICNLMVNELEVGNKRMFVGILHVVTEVQATPATKEDGV